MDKYLKAINTEEEKLSKLKKKTAELKSTNEKEKERIAYYQNEEKKLESEQELNFDRKDFLENKKSYIISFLKEALKFGGKANLFFWSFIVLVTILDYNLGNTLNLVFQDVLLGGIATSSILGYVEYYSVSRYFNTVIRGYKGDIDQDIELTNQKLLEVQKKRTKTEAAVSSNNLLLNELELAMVEVRGKILTLRTNRNDLIESLISELDVHIRNFEYQETDIQKVLEKKIQ